MSEQRGEGAAVLDAHSNGGGTSHSPPLSSSPPPSPPPPFPAYPTREAADPKYNIFGYFRPPPLECPFCE